VNALKYCIINTYISYLVGRKYCVKESVISTIVTNDLMCSMSVHYIIQNTNHQQMPKESFIVNRNTLLHVSTLLGHLQGELFCYPYTKFALYG
jgi:hypothetical protein